MAEAQKKAGWEHCGLNLLAVSRMWERRIEECLNGYGLSLRELMILRLIESDSQLQPKEMAVYTGDRQIHISRALGKLEEKVFLIRSTSKRRHCSLTDKGRHILQKADFILARQDRYFFGHLPRATRAGVNDTLESILHLKFSL